MWEELKKGKEKTKMPGIAKKPNKSGDCCDDNNTSYKAGNGSLPHHSFNGSSVSDKGFWSKPRDDVGYNQLQKFWRELALPARQKLLRIDKQTLLEHARKNMYCSRCNGLLLEGFLQISMYGRSLQQEAANSHDCGGSMNNQNGECLCMSKSNKTCNDFLDPAVHPWGGLTTTRDGMLTILDFYLYSESLKGLCNVFDSARARERERKLLYPDACGGGRRGWISQGMSGYGRGHATREACALHTARLSVETLLDFWSSLGEETQQSLLRIKEEDFIERLIYRFESKRFCRDCRRNVIREFKELKELKRLQKEPHCTSWFCVADTAFQYEVSHDTVQADWHQTFQDAFGTYRYFEWAIGTGDGKSDIMEFENVGLCGRVYVNGLDLSGLSACYITLKAWKNDGCYNKFCVKAYALRGKQCVHGRLVVADGYVTIMIRESIRRFFEHAEEAEEEEDDDSTEKDGNEIDGECSRPQKHAKNPELAREFLHDAATIIFKEQVEKAFRDGTARQNAHSIFVSHALKLLEERLFVACKEIITLEKQMKLLEEEEKEKREEEERRERKRTKEREKKMRRKERLREKENKEKYTKSNIDIEFSDVPKEDSFPCIGEDANVDNCRDSVSETCETTLHNSLLPGIRDDPLWMEGIFPNMQYHNGDILDGGFGSSRNQNPTFPCTHITYSRRKLKPHKDSQQDFILKLSSGRKAAGLSINETSDGSCESRFHDEVLESARSTNSSYKQVRANAPKSYTRNGYPRMSEKHQFENHGRGDRYDAHVRSCNHHIKHRSRSESHISRSVQGSKVKFTAGNTFTMKKVWEPLDSQKRDAQGDQGFDVASRSKLEVECDQFPESFDASSSYEIDVQDQFNNKDDNVEDLRSGNKNSRDKETEFCEAANSQNGTKVEVTDDNELCSMEKSSQETDSSVTNSDNSSSSLSEGDSLVSSRSQNVRCMSALDLDESCQISDGRDLVHPLKSDQFTDSNEVAEIQCTVGEHDAKGQVSSAGGPHSLSSLPTEGSTIHRETGRENVRISAQPDSVLPQMLSQRMQYPMFHAAPVMGGCYQQNPISWPAVPTNGLLPFPYSNQYMFANNYRYDLSGNTQLMPYRTVLHLAPPPHWLHHPSHVPVLPSVPAAPVTGVHINEYHKVASSVEGVHGTAQMEPTVKEAVQNEKVEDSDGEKNDGFSLFHFGGPVALSAGGFKADAVSLEEGSVEKTSCSELLENGNHPCSRRKDCIEEYNLFAAASTGIKFSIV